MRAPDRYPRQEPIDERSGRLIAPAVPTVYPLDDHVQEKLLDRDGKPMTKGTARKHPIGFHRQQAGAS